MGDESGEQGPEAPVSTLPGFVPDLDWPSDPDQTLRPPDPVSPVDKLVEELPTWSGELSLGGDLGRGGMGVVRLAEQRSLGRSVAVKQLLAERRHPSAQRKLLEEAWAAGCLEHPHIVPVYALARDRDGMPMMVQKHLDGMAWSDRIREDRGEGRLEGPDLEFHLDVLERVAQAVAFAHHRGVVHRDIKPHNVILGRFGEVALLDWGLAAALPSGDPRLPTLADCRHPAGTPSYMAPEQLVEDERRCGTGTDVYLLGGVFYELLVGRRPHEGPDVASILDRVRVNRPPLPNLLGDDARALLEASLADDPEDRPSAARFLDALRSYRSLRGARRLLEQALDARDAGVEAIEAGDLVDARQHTSEARFGMAAAEEAGASVSQAVRVELAAPMVRHHLDQGEPRMALSILDRFGVVDGVLRTQAEAAAASRVQDEAELEARAGQLDLTRGHRTRIFVGLTTMVVWLTTPLAVWGYEVMVAELPYSWLGGAVAVLTLASTGLSVWARESLSLSVANRFTAIALPTSMGLLAVALLHGWWVGRSTHEAIALAQVGWAVLGLVAGSVYRPLLVLIGVAHVLGLVVTALRPDLVWLVIAACNIVFAMTVLGPERSAVDDLVGDWLRNRE